MSENKSEKKNSFLLARIEDACQNNYEPHYFDFYDEVFQQKIEDTIKQNGVPYLFFGGHPEAERKMLCIYPDYFSGDELEWPIFSLEFKKTFQVDHRNILGELMHLGITRESIGDIDVGDENIQIIAHSRLKDFLWLNFNRVKGREVKINLKDWRQIETFLKNYQRLSIVVASNRLDGIINKIWGFSRQNSLVYIKQGKVRVNYAEINKNDYRLQAGDVISLRSKGKAKIISMDDRTKKGNLRLEVDKYV